LFSKVFVYGAKLSEMGVRRIFHLLILIIIFNGLSDSLYDSNCFFSFEVFVDFFFLFFEFR